MDFKNKLFENQIPLALKYQCFAIHETFPISSFICCYKPFVTNLSLYLCLHSKHHHLEIAQLLQQKKKHILLPTIFKMSFEQAFIVMLRDFNT